MILFVLFLLVDLVAGQCSFNCHAQTEPEWRHMLVDPMVGRNSKIIPNVDFDNCKEEADKWNANIIVFNRVSDQKLDEHEL